MSEIEKHPEHDAPLRGEVVVREPSVFNTMADRYGMAPGPFEATVRAICMPAQHTREQFAAFLLVAKEYRLNPLTKEIYAFPARDGGIIPVVSIDGWVSLVNSHKACDGFDFSWEQDADGKPVSCTCTMYRKDRTHPVVVTEYLAECERPTEPWKMKHRMLRHKAMIQCARYAFGFSGIYDPDEAEKIVEVEAVRQIPPTPPAPPPPPPPESDGPPTNDPDPEPPAAKHEPKTQAYLDRLTEELDDVDDAESVNARFDEVYPPPGAEEDDVLRVAAHAVRDARLAALREAEPGMFDEDLPPESKAAIDNMRAG